MKLTEEIAEAEVIEGDEWDALIVCSPEAASALRTAACQVDPYLSVRPEPNGVRFTSKRPPKWAQTIHAVKNRALDVLLDAAYAQA